MIELYELNDKLSGIRKTEPYWDAKCTGKKINGKPHLVIMGNKEMICIELDEE